MRIWLTLELDGEGAWLYIDGENRTLEMPLNAEIRLGLVLAADPDQASSRSEDALARGVLTHPALALALAEELGDTPERADLVLKLMRKGHKIQRLVIPFWYVPGMGAVPRGPLRRPGLTEPLHWLISLWRSRSMAQRQIVVVVIALMAILSRTEGWWRVEALLGAPALALAPAEFQVPIGAVPILTVDARVPVQPDAVDFCAIAEALRQCADQEPAVIALDVDRYDPGPGFASLTAAVAEVEGRGIDVITGTSFCPEDDLLRLQDPQAWCPGDITWGNERMLPLLQAERASIASLGLSWYNVRGGDQLAVARLERWLEGRGGCGERRYPSLGYSIALARARRTGEPLQAVLNSKSGYPWAYLSVPWWMAGTQDVLPEGLESDDPVLACAPEGAVLLTTPTWTLVPPEQRTEALARGERVRLRLLTTFTTDGTTHAVPTPRLHAAVAQTLAGEPVMVPWDAWFARQITGSDVAPRVAGWAFIVGLGLYLTLAALLHMLLSRWTWRWPLFTSLGLLLWHGLLGIVSLVTVQILLPVAATGALWTLQGLQGAWLKARMAQRA
ncbi:MAG: hypothetical protein H6739_24975 [Alphaproteobacteria bacterium]|nr:hypothetical protein [Alphaproteobacteria bacterium]